MHLKITFYLLKRERSMLAAFNPFPDAQYSERRDKLLGSQLINWWILKFSLPGTNGLNMVDLSNCAAYF